MLNGEFEWDSPATGSSFFFPSEGMMSAFLHLTKITPALPDILELAVASEPPDEGPMVTFLRASSR